MEALIYISIGFILGLYTSHKRFRTEINALLKRVINFLRDLRIRDQD